MQYQIENALALHQQGRLSEAEAIYRAVLAASPRQFAVLNFLGILETQRGRHEQAIKCFKKALADDATNPALHSNMGNALQGLGRHKEAIQSYDRALALKPDHLEALYNRATSLHELGRLQDALATYDQALILAPDDASLHNNKGLVLQDLGRLDEAMASYDRALTLAPQTAESAVNRGDLLHILKRYDEALSCYDQALSIDPHYAEAWSNKGAVYGELKQHDEALNCYDKALGIDPALYTTLLNKCAVLNELRQYEHALACCEKLLSTDGDFSKSSSNKGAPRSNKGSQVAERSHAWSNKGTILVGLTRWAEALTCYEKAISINSKNAIAWVNKALLLIDDKRLDDALTCFDKALAIEPGLPPHYGNRLHIKMSVCEWNNVESESEILFQKIRAGEIATPPFPVLGLSDDPLLQRSAAKLWVDDRWPARSVLGEIPKRPRHEKIRIAYLSADFREHPGGYNFVGLFEHLDRTRFDIFAISFYSAPASAIRTRLIQAFDRFIDAEDKSDREVASLMRDLQIDIAVDIMGPTQNAREGVFALRAAPIQVNQFGWTSAAPYMDYLVSDEVTIPGTHLPFYSEKVAYVPNTWFPTDGKRQMPAQTPSRTGAGLPEHGLVFCSFVNSFKITPEVFSVWMRILKATGESVLWLRDHNATMIGNLRREAEQHGINPDRLIFAPVVKQMEDHLARYRLADLFLDTFPFTAQTTSVDALWAGLPVLTRMGESSISRLAGSILYAVGLHELVTTSIDDYERLAIELASQPERLAKLRQQLDENRLSKPLFDTARYTRHIEDAFTQMYERYHSDLAPEHIFVKAT